jgi:hypothetical protein
VLTTSPADTSSATATTMRTITRVMTCADYRAELKGPR